jgi:hypothetical protein
MDLLKIVLKNGEPTCRHRIVTLTEGQVALLKGKGEGGYVHIRKEHLKYKNEQDGENNQ